MADNNIDASDSLVHTTMAVKSLPKSENEDKARFFSGIVSSAALDREHETITPKGIDTRAFMAAGGPILAGSHFHEAFNSGQSAVVARALKVTKSSDKLVLNKGEFDTDPISEHYRGKVQRGFLRGFSVGLIPLEVDYGQSRQNRTIRKIIKSELLHIVITCQPVNRETLIAAKSTERIARLENKLDTLLKSENGLDKMEQISVEIANLAAEVATLKSVVVKTGRQEQALSATEALVNASDKLLDLALKAAHPELPDAAFIIEKGAEREGGQVVRKYRHLPHHTKAVKSPDDNQTINKALLRNALARVNQVKPVRESKEAYVARALRHLRRHAKAVGIGSDAD